MSCNSCHLDSCFGCFGAFVAQRTASTVEGLLLVVGSEHAEDYWHVLRGVEHGASLGGVVTHIVEMRSAATYHAAYHYHGIEIAALSHLCCGKGKLYCSWHALHGDVVAAVSCLNDAVLCSVEQLLSHLAVPSCCHNAHFVPLHMRKLY